MQFFGLGNRTVQRRLERLPGALHAMTVIIEHDSSGHAPPLQPPRYVPRYVLPSEGAVLEVQRQRAAREADVKPNASGCARAESRAAVVSESAQSKRVTRALLGNSASVEPNSSAPAGRASGRAQLRTKLENTAAAGQDEIDIASTWAFDRVNAVTAMYRKMKEVPIHERVIARRSHVHGWGLFLLRDIRKHEMIVEYMGETVRSCVADLREKVYDQEGHGSCYLFRLDRHEIVDATRKGSLARFINHCCSPNAYAKVIQIEGGAKKIVFFALRDMAAQEEVFYDYKFPVEDDKIPCTCGAPNCRRFLN